MLEMFATIQKSCKVHSEIVHEDKKLFNSPKITCLRKVYLLSKELAFFSHNDCKKTAFTHYLQLKESRLGVIT